ncbi:LAQU0S23e00958g1_1 [Lachancea quebecensis]|uniref:LAQU0S23e00958g1_1 n=1 Tax=Lachancea quebecensis TaxID=1654605 RepID=A0A0P1KZW0_9SACH|nr:LAQU0S23e00958g1_1 [Lachancea quebecensis]
MLRNVSRRLLVPGSKLFCSSLLRPRCLSMIGAPRFISSSAMLKNEQKKDGDKINLGTLKVEKPQLMIAFTCKKCNNRSSHTMSKQAYTKGTVLIQCPGCKSRHLIADHLKIFSDDHITVEDIMSAKGESVSSTTDDLAFEDIPEKLKSVIGHYAKDAPSEMKQKLDNESVHALPHKNEVK